MVPWWKRLIYSTVAVVLSGSICGGLVGANNFYANLHGLFSGTALLDSMVIFGFWVVLLSLPGWGLAIPIVLAVRDVTRWRFWVYWAAGACFGPALILSVAAYDAVRAPNSAGTFAREWSLMGLAGSISTLTTLIHLLLLRRARNKALDSTAVEVV